MAASCSAVTCMRYTGTSTQQCNWLYALSTLCPHRQTTAKACVRIPIIPMIKLVGSQMD
jgi:hypothetical protein